jgi:hypothetical protein
MRRALAAALLAILTLGSAPAVTCAGWESAPSDRMACCKRAGNHDCPDQRTADNCCAAHEQSRQLLPLLMVPIAAPPAPIAALTAPLMDAMALNRASAMLLDVLAAERLDRPPDLVASPLRI